VDFAQLARINAEPTPSAIEPILVKHLELNGPSRRADLLAAVESSWKRASGQPMKGSLTAKVKKALQQLASQGIVRPTGHYGIWSLVDSALEPPEEIAIAGFDDTTKEEEAELPDEPVAAETEVGTGPQIVYAYYLNVYREAAQLQGADRWPIKVGMTTGPLEDRMAAHRTALPDAPKVAVIIRTENAALLEKVLHGILTLRGHRYDASGGSEWFTTNPQEVVDLYEWIEKG
jgi:T5orf172 domain